MSPEKTLEVLYDNCPESMPSDLHKECVDLLIEAKALVRKKVAQAKVTKTCLNIMQGFAYLASSFSSTLSQPNIRERLGFPSEVYTTSIESMQFFSDYFNTPAIPYIGIFALLPDSKKEFEDVAYDPTNSFVSLLTNFYMMCIAEYYDGRTYGLYNQAQLMEYFNDLLSTKGDFSLVNEELYILVSDIREAISPTKSAIRAICKSQGVLPDSYLEHLSIPIARGIPWELWEVLQDAYEKYLHDCAIAPRTGPNMPVATCARAIGCTPQRVYQLIETGDLNFIAKDDPDNDTNQVQIKFSEAERYLHSIRVPHRQDVSFLLIGLSKYSHLEPTWSDVI